MREAVAQARALDHPQPLAFALLFEIFVHLARRNPREVQRTYDQLAVVCHAHGIAQEIQWAAPLCGRALLELGDAKRGLRVHRGGAGRAHDHALGPAPAVLFRAARGRVSPRARSTRAPSGRSTTPAPLPSRPARTPTPAEQCRLQAELLLATGRMDEAERNYLDALTTARTQGARWLELRAARAYANFQAAQHRTDEAVATLRPVVIRITEGRDTLDYVYAETLLEALGEPPDRGARGAEPPEPGTSESVDFLWRRRLEKV